MSRRVRRLAVVVLVLLVVAAVAIVLTTRPKLEDSRKAVDRAWAPLRAPLSARYDQLADMYAQTAAAGAGERAVAQSLEATLSRWVRLRQTAADEHNYDADAEAKTADELEGLATRLRVVVQSSDRLRGVEPLNQAIAAFQGTRNQQLQATVDKYNHAVRGYEDERNGLLRSPVASLFGYDSRPQLLLAG